MITSHVHSDNVLSCGPQFSSLKHRNVIVCYSGTNAGSLAVYSCLSCGFKAASEPSQWSFIRMCTEEGLWNRTIPDCDCSKTDNHALLIHAWLTYNY